MSSNTQQVNTRVSISWVEIIEGLVESEIYGSVSAFIRDAIRDKLIELGKFNGLAESSEEEKEDTSNGLKAHEEVSKIEPEAQVV